MYCRNRIAQGEYTFQIKELISFQSQVLDVPLDVSNLSAAARPRARSHLACWRLAAPPTHCLSAGLATRRRPRSSWVPYARMWYACTAWGSFSAQLRKFEKLRAAETQRCDPRWGRMPSPYDKPTSVDAILLTTWEALQLTERRGRAYYVSCGDFWDHTRDALLVLDN